MPNNLPFRQSHAILIGVSIYDNFEDLETPIRDIEAIEAVLTSEIHDYQVSKLQNPTKLEFSNFLESYANNVKNDDRILLYFAGHGIAIDADNQGASGYLLPSDADNQSFENAIPMRYIRSFIDNLPCRHGLVVLDCCFAGAFKWDVSTRKLGMMPKRIYQQRFDRFVTDNAWQVITSASYDQEAIDYVGDTKVGQRNIEDRIFNTDNSPFAAAFINGLKGDADIVPSEPDGLITATELYLYLRETLEPVTIELGDNYRQTPRIFALPQHDKGEYLFLSPTHPLNLPERDRRNPYKGLASFEQSDSELFYGRERVIEELLEHIKQSPNGFTVLTGASGTGKSSLVKAGLLPYLNKNDYSILPVTRPGRTPVQNLIQNLNLSNDELTNNEERAINKLISSKKVIVIDQFEELITQCETKEEREKFIDLLSKITTKNTNGQIIIIITIRSDFEPQLKDERLERYWQQARFTAPPFSASELKAVILQPANQAVVEFEPPELVDTIVNEVIQAPGALPLLSFLLYELYETSGAAPDRPMRKADYDRLGGVIGSLRTRADEVFKDCSDADKATMKKLMIRMIAQDGGEIARRRVLRKELEYPTDEENQRVEIIIEKLEKARLIVASGEGNEQYIEPAHDALVRAWGSLWEWIKEFGEDTIIVKNILDRDLKDYQAHQHDKKRLWDDNPRLDQLVEISKQEHNWLTKDEYEFIHTSQKLKRRNRNRLITIVTVIIAVISGLAINANNNANVANEKTKIANEKTLEAEASADTANMERIKAQNELAQRELLEIEELLRAGEIFKASNDYDLALERYQFIKDKYLTKDYLQVYLKDKKDTITMIQVNENIKLCNQKLR